MDQFQQRVVLHDLRFYAFHGYYPEEQVLGNEFMVTVDAAFDRPLTDTETLDNTVDYEWVYGVIREEMEQPRKLLETVAAAILNRIRHHYVFVREISVQLTKCHPPFGGDQAKATVALNWKR